MVPSDATASPGLSMDEVQRRLPAVTLIEDDRIRTETMVLASDAPAYFWEVPASTSGYHHPICRRTHGLWAHTLMVCTAVRRLADSYEAQHGVDPDHAYAAAILHDMRKNGGPDAPAETSVSDHDLLMAAVIREESELPDDIADTVAAHMGPWYDGPEPETPLEQLVHDADMLASTATATLQVPGPVPDELADHGVEPIDTR